MSPSILSTVLFLCWQGVFNTGEYKKNYYSPCSLFYHLIILHVFGSRIFQQFFQQAVSHNAHIFSLKLIACLHFAFLRSCTKVGNLHISHGGDLDAETVVVCSGLPESSVIPGPFKTYLPTRPRSNCSDMMTQLLLACSKRLCTLSS